MSKVEFAADLETPVSAFLKLAPLEPVFLLESAEKNEAVGRFSDSIPEREYEEIANKAMALRTVLKMAEEGF
jgi:anthranilate/para-aminobenzoate synthase component I